MFKITLSNNKAFFCEENSTIFDAAKNAKLLLDHSCLSARCRSCAVKIVSGKTQNLFEENVLSEEERGSNFVLSCNAKPLSDLVLDIEDLSGITIHDKRIIPSKIDSINYLSKSVVKVSLRLPPNSNFNFNPGQYVNIIKGDLTRSYSISNSPRDTANLEFYIRKYENGLMSKYWFEEAKENDLLRIEGPIGTFFLRESSYSNIVFIATGTGIAPIKSIIESIETSEIKNKETKFWVILGARNEEDIFWDIFKSVTDLNIEYITVLSKPSVNWNGPIGYVQDVVLKLNLDLSNTQVYACGSDKMIESAKNLFIQNSLLVSNFYSDAFIQTN